MHAFAQHMFVCVVKIQFGYVIAQWLKPYSLNVLFRLPMCAPDVFQLQQDGFAAHNRSADLEMVARL